jgi:biotin carboxyl carrier protein
MSDSLTLRIKQKDDGSGWEVLSPGVGYYVLPPEKGDLVQGGQEAGMLVTLERNYPLVLPEEVMGYVETNPADRRHTPVGYGDHLFSVKAGGKGRKPGGRSLTKGRGAALAVKASQAGRFWRKPDPDSPQFVEPGDILTAGKTIGILEVMKTFNPIKYEPGHGLPKEAKVVRFMVGDGEEVGEGQPLIELEKI